MYTLLYIRVSSCGNKSLEL